MGESANGAGQPLLQFSTVSLHRQRKPYASGGVPVKALPTDLSEAQRAGVARGAPDPLTAAERGRCSSTEKARCRGLD